MTVPKVLIVYYSQTGQLSALAQYFAKPLQQAGVVTDCVPLVPQQPYPFPWPFWRFFDPFPETAHLRPAPIEPPQIPHDDYDAVVIAYTVWFLAPSQPITAFLQRPETRRLLAGKPVITLIGCRNMWLAAQEKMKTLLAANGAQLVGNIVKTDACGTAASFVTTPAWLLTGNKRYFRSLPAAGIAENELADGARFGEKLRDALLAGAPLDETLFQNMGGAGGRKADFQRKSRIPQLLPVGQAADGGGARVAAAAPRAAGGVHRVSDYADSDRYPHQHRAEKTAASAAQTPPCPSQTPLCPAIRRMIFRFRLPQNTGSLKTI